MNILFWTAILIFLSFSIQLIVWKIHLPKRQTLFLLFIFFTVLVFGLFSIKFFFHSDSILAVNAYSEYLHISLFFISLTLAYMITYSAIEVDSPSLVMIKTIGSAGTNGLEAKFFDKIMNDDLLIMPRLQDLLNDNMAYYKNGKYFITRKGCIFARIFIIYRRLLNASEGG